MRKTIFKETFREVRRSLGRFLAILIMVMLGVTFYVGFNAMGPDLSASSTRYFSQTHFHNYHVLSNVGFDSDDLTAIRSLKNAENVQAFYTLDAIEDYSGHSGVAHVMSLPESVDTLTVVQGRLPQSAGECVVDEQKNSVTPQIGQTVTLTSGNSDKLSDKLHVTRFRVVGIVESPAYLSRDRGTSKIGSGKVSGLLFVQSGVFDLSAYTEVDVTATGLSGLDVFDSRYYAAAAALGDSLETLAPVRTKAWHDKTVSDANAKLADEQSAYDEQKAQAEQSLADAQKKIDSAQSQLDMAKNQLAQARKQADEQTAAAQAKLDDAESELTEQTAAYDKSRAAYEQSAAAAKPQMGQAEQGIQTLDANLSSLQDKQQALTANISTLLNKKQMLTANISTLTNKKQQLTDNIQSLQTKQQALEAELAAGEASGSLTPEQIEQLQTQIAAIQSQLDTLESSLAAVQSSLSKAQAGLTEVQADLAKAQDGLDTVQANLAALTKKRNDAQATLTSKQKQLANAKAELDTAEQQLDAASAQLAEQNAALAAARKQTAASFAEKQKELDQKQADVDQSSQTLAEQRADTDKKLNDAAAQIADAKQQIADIETPTWSVQGRDHNAGYSNLKSTFDRNSGISGILPILFFSIAALVCLTAMTRMVEEKRTQIGTFKALGYGGGTIASQFLFYAGLASALGSAAGISFGFYALPRLLFHAYTSTLALPVMLLFAQPGVAAIAAGIALSVILAATALTCVNELRAVPAVLLRAAAPKAGKRILLERISFLWKRMSFSHKVTARNLFRYKKRFWMTVLGVACCTALLVSGFGLHDSISTQVSKREFGGILKYGMTVQMKDSATGAQMADVTALLKKTSGVRSVLESTQKTVTAQNGVKTQQCSLVVPQKASALANYIGLHTVPGRLGKKSTPLQLTDDGAVITAQLAQNLHLKQGDTLTLQDDGTHTHTFRVTGIAENYLMNYVFVSPAAYQKAYGAGADVNQLMVDLDAGAAEDTISATVMKQDGVAAVSLLSDLQKTFGDTVKSMNGMVAVIIAAALLLAAVVLFTLTSINISERFREIATIKVLGFYDREVSGYITRESYILTLVGILLGWVGGTVLHAYLLNVISVNNVMFVQSILPQSYLISAALTLLFTWLINLSAMGSLRGIDMVEALKETE